MRAALFMALPMYAMRPVAGFTRQCTPPMSMPACDSSGMDVYKGCKRHT